MQDATLVRSAMECIHKMPIERRPVDRSQTGPCMLGRGISRPQNKSAALRRCMQNNLGLRGKRGHK